MELALPLVKSYVDVFKALAAHVDSNCKPMQLRGIAKYCKLSLVPILEIKLSLLLSLTSCSKFNPTCVFVLETLVLANNAASGTAVGLLNAL
jgi:hypothetical protein